MFFLSKCLVACNLSAISFEKVVGSCPRFFCDPAAFVSGAATAIACIRAGGGGGITSGAVMYGGCLVGAGGGGGDFNCGAFGAAVKLIGCELEDANSVASVLEDATSVATVLG